MLCLTGLCLKLPKEKEMAAADLRVVARVPIRSSVVAGNLWSWSSFRRHARGILPYSSIAHKRPCVLIGLEEKCGSG